MKIAKSVALVLFFASKSDGFGAGTPLLRNTPSSPFGVSRTSSSRRGDVTMRVGVVDLSRRQKFNRLLKTGNTSKETVQSELLSASTSSLIEKCNWKLRKLMIRKVKAAASKFDIEVDPGFGQPPTQAEREAAEMADGAERQKDKVEHYNAVAEKAAEKAQINEAKNQLKIAREELKKSYREARA